MTTSAAAETTPVTRVIPEWSLGDRLRKARRLSQLGQAEFAERLGQNQKTYAAWELDTSQPRDVVSLARRIEVLTGIPAGWLLAIESPFPSAVPQTYEADQNRRATRRYLIPERRLVVVPPQVDDLSPQADPNSVALNAMPDRAIAGVIRRTNTNRTNQSASAA